MQTKTNVGNTQVRVRAALLLWGSMAALAAPMTWRPGTTAAPGDPTGLVVVVAAWAAWALTIYLCLGTAVTAATYLRVGPLSLARCAPPMLRRCVAVVVGASSAAAVCLAPALAYADSPAPAPAPVATASPLDWPGLAPVVAEPEPTRLVVVRPGDSLWSLTARRLGPHASAARIAASWPRLYTANRRAIGANPNLIHPGQQLVAPAPEGRTSR